MVTTSVCAFFTSGLRGGTSDWEKLDSQNFVIINTITNTLK